MTDIPLRVVCIIIIIMCFGIICKIDDLKSYMHKNEIETIYLDRNQITKSITNALIENPNDVYSFYNEYTHDREITRIIVETCYIMNMPYNLVFSLVYNESRYNPYAINNKNISDTVDYGLFQLNSRIYAEHEKKYLMNIKNNIMLGCEHLRKDFQITESWRLALIKYNCGRIKNVPGSTIKHMDNILNYEQKLNKEWYQWKN